MHLQSSIWIKIIFENGEKIKKGAKICEWDPYTTPIIAEKDGIANYVDLIDGVSIAETVDDETGISKKQLSIGRLNQKWIQNRLLWRLKRKCNFKSW